jgi:hypothetical protein
MTKGPKPTVDGSDPNAGGEGPDYGPAPPQPKRSENARQLHC